MRLPIKLAIFRSKRLIIRILLIVFLFGGTFVQSLSAQVLTCPDDYVVHLPHNECDVTIFYDTLTWSANFPAFDPVYFPFPGTDLPTGITTVTLAVSGPNNTFYTCEFEVNVLADGSTNFICPGIVSVSLNGQCERPLIATDILGNVFDPCDQDYKVEIQQGNVWVPGLINAGDVGNSYNVLLTNVETNHACESIVTVTGGEPSSITCPPNLVQYCNVPTDTSYAGIPELTGCFENVSLSYSDELTFTNCPDTFAFQITRTWFATSPNGSQSSCVQSITGKRFPVSLVVFPPDLNNISSPALTCEDNLNLTQTAHPDITGWPLVDGFQPDDNLHCKFAVSYVDNITHLCGDSYQIKRAWSVVRLCGPNTVRDTQTILVLDEMAPFFDIPDTLYFSKSGGCVDSVFLPAANVTAECSNYNVLLHSDWGDFTTNGHWIKPDTVAGNYLVDYTMTDACGNDTTQTLVLKITDETLVSCPPNDTVTCDYYFSVISPAIQLANFNVLNAHGLPTFYSNCSFDITQNASAVVNGCGVGVVTRNITATNETDTLSCTQSIFVEHVSNFIVKFPADTSICTSPLLANLPEPSVTYVNCESISPSFTDVIIPSGVAGCYTLERTWVLINECVFADTVTGPDSLLSSLTFQDNGDGYMEYKQTIQVNNNAPISFPNGCEIPDKYLQADDCVLDMSIPLPTIEGCGSNINLTVSGSLGTNLGATVGVSPGIYSVTYKAVDGCGKMKTCLTSFEVFDTIAPVAICKTNFAVSLLQSGQVEVLAGNLNNGSHDNCVGNLDFSFSADPYDISRIFTCDDLGLQTTTIWVGDVHGNHSTCVATLEVQNGTPCSEPPLIGGTIENEIGFGIQNVKVEMVGLPSFQAQDLTDSNGDYLLQGDKNVSSYTLTPEKDTLPLNGVTTFDLVLIRRHILNIETLDSPYKMIAADINNSGSVTTFDIVEIRKVILLINATFPNNKSWRFVDAAYVFPNPSNPFSSPWPESITVNNVQGDLLGLNFIGIKIGDVNNSANTSLIQGPDQNRTKLD